MVIKPEYLFSSKELRSFLEDRLVQSLQHVDGMDSDRLLGTPLQDLVNEIVEDYSLEPLNVIEDQMSQLLTEEIRVDISQDLTRFVLDRTRPMIVPGSRITVVLPCSGHRELFQMKPSRSYLGKAPVGTIGKSEILLTYRDMDPRPEKVRSFIDEQLKMIRDLVEWSNNDVAGFNKKLASETQAAIERRKSRLQRDRGLDGALGFPVRRRGDAPIIIPVNRKRLGIHNTRARQPGTVEKYQDEYSLDMQTYDEIIDVVSGMARMFERSPSTFAHMKEEMLRDHILVQLNGTFEGQAAGELFNGFGKTDILIRIEDRNVFIGECKIWSGEKAFAKAIDQLLGYLVWRDSKAALVVFIRQKDASTIIDKGEITLQKHPHFKRMGLATSDSSIRRNFVMHQRDDVNREIHLALLPLVMPVSEAHIDGI